MASFSKHAFPNCVILPSQIFQVLFNMPHLHLKNVIKTPTKKCLRRICEISVKFPKPQSSGRRQSLRHTAHSQPLHHTPPPPEHLCIGITPAVSVSSPSSTIHPPIGRPTFPTYFVPTRFRPGRGPPLCGRLPPRTPLPCLPVLGRPTVAAALRRRIAAVDLRRRVLLHSVGRITQDEDSAASS